MKAAFKVMVSFGNSQSSDTFIHFLSISQRWHFSRSLLPSFKCTPRLTNSLSFLLFLVLTNIFFLNLVSLVFTFLSLLVTPILPYFQIFLAKNEKKSFRSAPRVLMHLSKNCTIKRYKTLYIYNKALKPLN